MAEGKADTGIVEFVRENQKLWHPYTEKLEIAADKCILVDLLVGHPGYIIGNASIAKYLQAHLGCELVGLVPNSDIPAFTAIAQSFGITRLVRQPDFTDKKHSEVLPILNSIINGLRKGDVGENILKIKVNSMPLGDLFYDSYLRDTGKSTISGLDEDLTKSLFVSLVLLVHYTKVFERLNVVATVQAHVVYARFGIFARLALQNGADVFSRKPAESPISIRHYRALEQLPSYECRFTEDAFNLLWQHNRKNAVAAGRQYLAERFAGKDAMDDAEQAFGAGKKTYGRDELLAKLNLPPDRFTVFVMAHVFCDAPHTHHWSLYVDFYEWFVDTINQAMANDKVNWVIKPHPSESIYSGATSARQVVSELVGEARHVALAPDDLHTGSLPKLADAIVTVMGTAGLELPAMGIPAVLAGESAYSGFGFTIEPQTQEEYRSILATIEDVPRPTEEQVERALTYAHLYFNVSRVESTLIPPMAAANTPEYLENSERYWAEAAELARKLGSVEHDPVYQNFTEQLRAGSDHMLNSARLGA